MKKEKEWAIVTAIIRNEKGEVLVEDHVKKDGLVFPGGKIEGDEDSLVTLKRELQEELGIEVTEADFVEVFEASGPYPHDSDNIITWDSYVYEIKAYNGVPTNMEPSKCRGISWMNETELVLDPRLKERYYLDGGGQAFKSYCERMKDIPGPISGYDWGTYRDMMHRGKSVYGECVRHTE